MSSTVLIGIIASISFKGLNHHVGKGVPLHGIFFSFTTGEIRSIWAAMLCPGLSVPHISITHDEVVVATWVMREPDPKSHLATCFLGPFLVLFVLVKGLKETDAKRNRCANDLLGENPGKDKGRETKRR